MSVQPPTEEGLNRGLTTPYQYTTVTELYTFNGFALATHCRADADLRTRTQTDRQTDTLYPTCSFSLLASMGMTLRMGSSSMSTLGGDFLKHMLTWSQQPPSRYMPLTKQPDGARSVTCSGLVYCSVCVMEEWSGAEGR